MNATQTKIAAVVADLNAAFPQRREAVLGAIVAVLVKEHAFYIGPPGTGKSALIRAVASALGGMRYFDLLMTRFTTPEEPFGPVSLRGLEQDRFERVVTGKLPEAEIAFIDETYKANSAILNSLLTLMNERTFHNGNGPIPCPLVSLFGASNELPEGKELEALHDRFLLRFEVSYLHRDSDVRAMLAAPEPKAATTLTRDEVAAAQAEVAAVKVTDATVDALLAIRSALKAEGIVTSDRRWKKLLKVAQASAYLAGETETTPADLMLLADALWREPKERAKIASVVGSIADPVSAKAAEIVDAAREGYEKVQGLQTGDRKAYIAAAAGAIEAAQKQEAHLAALRKTAGKRAGAVLDDATAEVKGLRADLARTVSAGLGIR